MSLSHVALWQSLFIELYSFRGVRHHSAELTCVATRHTFPEQHKVLRLLLQKVVHPNDVVSSKSTFQGAFERMTSVRSNHNEDHGGYRIFTGFSRR